MSACEHCGESHPGGAKFCPGTGKLIAERLLAPGTLLERKYRVGRPLGAGGMGAVFEATHDLLGHSVAIKVLLPELSRDAEMSSRLIREGRAASATGHRNIATVTDMGRTEEGSLFVVMEYLDGSTLTEIVDELGALTVRRAAALVCQVLDGLEAVHQAAIVHRDLKPDNVMVVREGDEEVAKILDFGISKMADEGTKAELTATGLVFGTPAYMAPEQTRGAATVDHRADLYSAGAILYKLLTGSAPVVAPTLAGLLAKLVQGEIDPPSSLRAEVTASLDRVVMRGLATAPEQRFADARSFRRALKPFAEAAAAPAPPPIAPQPKGAGAKADFIVADDHQFDDDSLVHLDELGPAAAAPTPSPAPVAPAPRRRDEPAAPPAEAAPAEAAFFPPADEPLESPAKAELDRAPAREPTPPSPAVDRQPERVLHQGSGSARRSVGGVSPTVWIGLVLALVAAGAYYLTRGEDNGAPAPVQPQVVQISLETTPPRVDIRVDGVLQVAQPIKLPRSSRTFTVRVDAKGHRGKALRVVADRDQRLEVVLDRLDR